MISDPYFILPVLTAAMNYYNIVSNTNRNQTIKLIASM